LIGRGGSKGSFRGEGGRGNALFSVIGKVLKAAGF
jgi:hypothetical protein